MNIDYFVYDEVAVKTPPNAQNRPATSLFPQRATTELIEAYIRDLWGDKAETMIKIVACESGFNPKAINWNDAKITGMPSQGVAQINAPYNEKLFDWKYNLDVAFEMYQRRSFQPWSCYGLIAKI